MYCGFKDFWLNYNQPLRGFMKKIIFSILSFPLILFSQTLDYFPIHIGDEFQYESTTSEGNQKTFYKEVITNLIDKDDGGIDVFYNNSKEPRYYKSKNGNVYLYSDNKPYLWFDFTTSAIDTYYTKWSGIENNVIVYSYNTMLFNKNTTARSFSFKDIKLHFSFGYYLLADEFGIVEKNSHLMYSSIDRLIGCVINGIKYGTIVSVKEKNINTNYELSQNYPNPFNPETTISYKVQAASKVILKVYDLLGKEVATLVDQYKQPGSYTVAFNVKTRHGVSLQSGVYFYRLQAGSFSETKKMILLK